MYGADINAPLGGAAGKTRLALVLAPYLAAVGLLTTWWDWYGIFGGIAAFWLLRKIGQFIIRRLHAHANFAQWGGYLNPGARIDVKLAPPTRGPPAGDWWWHSRCRCWADREDRRSAISAPR